VLQSGLDASKQYWLGVYYPATANVTAIPAQPYPAAAPWTANAAIKYTNYLAAGTTDGYYDLELVNAYMDARIWLFEGTIEAPLAVASSPVITFTDNDAPLRGHIARTAANDQMRVVWNSKDQDESNVVQWGTATGVYTSSAASTPYTYAKEDMCGAPANGFGWSDPFWWNWALITDLQPSTVYFYRFGNSANSTWSDERSFISAPALGPHQAINIGAIADQG
jgi:hypothetical protein